MADDPALRTFLSMWDRAVGTVGYFKGDWKQIRNLFSSPNAGGMEEMTIFLRLRDQAKMQPDFDEADWRAVGDALGFHDDFVDSDYVRLGDSVYLVDPELGEALAEAMREHGMEVG